VDRGRFFVPIQSGLLAMTKQDESRRYDIVFVESCGNLTNMKRLYKMDDAANDASEELEKIREEQL